MITLRIRFETRAFWITKQSGAQLRVISFDRGDMIPGIHTIHYITKEKKGFLQIYSKTGMSFEIEAEAAELFVK